MREVQVGLDSNSYHILIGSGLLMQTAYRLKENGFAGKLVIITNPVVEKLYSDILKQSLAQEGFEVAVLSVADGEEQKAL